VYPDGHKEQVISLGDPDGNTFDRQHRLIDCASVLRAIIAITPEGKYKALAERYEGKKFNSPMTWGDKDYHSLYITATTSVYRLETRTQGFVPYLEH
jgi:gluconolactonase